MPPMGDNRSGAAEQRISDPPSFALSGPSRALLSPFQPADEGFQPADDRSEVVEGAAVARCYGPDVVKRGYSSSP